MMDSKLIEELPTEPGTTQAETAASRTAVKSKRDEFVKIFVAEFEAKLVAYHLAIKCLIKKPGKLSDICAKTLGRVVGGLTFGIVTFFVCPPAASVAANQGAMLGKKTFKKLGDWLGNANHKRKVEKLAHLVSEFVEDKEKFRLKLVENGFDLFQCFEMQFLFVANEKMALIKLARDARDRAIDCLSERNDLTIAESVIFGESKMKTDLGIPRAGFKIAYKQDLKEVVWRTADLFEKTGIVIENGDSLLYFKKRGGKSETKKYFYRRPLLKEDRDNIKKTYDEDGTVNLPKFPYTSNPADVQKESKILLEKLNIGDNTINIDLKKLTTEYLGDIKRELQSLGFEMTCPDTMSDYTNLVNRKVKKYTTKVDGDNSDDDCSPDVPSELTDLLKEVDTLAPYLVELNFDTVLQEYFEGQGKITK